MGMTRGGNLKPRAASARAGAAGGTHWSWRWAPAAAEAQHGGRRMPGPAPYHCTRLRERPAPRRIPLGQVQAPALLRGRQGLVKHRRAVVRLYPTEAARRDRGSNLRERRDMTRLASEPTAGVCGWWSIFITAEDSHRRRIKASRAGSPRRSLPKDPNGYCGEPSGCLDIFNQSGGDQIGYFAKNFNMRRVIVLGNVKGDTVVIWYAGPPDTFNKFAPKAQKVVDTVKWGGS